MKDFKRKGFAGGIKQGGGFLNNVIVTMKDYEFTTIPPNGKEESEQIYFVPTFRQDGADKDITQHFFMGQAENYEISKDGKTVSAADGGNVTFGGKIAFGKLMTSILASGFDESELPDLEAGDDLNLEALVGKRYRVVQEIDEAANAKLGKRKVKDPKTKKTVEYNRTNTVVTEVLDGDAAPTKGSAKGAAKAASKSKKDDSADLTEEADSVMADVLGDNDGEIERGKLSLKLTVALNKNPNREALKKLMLSDEYLTSEDREAIFTLEGKGAKQKLVAA